MWYWLSSIAAAAWVFFDARKRQMELSGAWSAATAIAMVLALPFYLSRRTLVRGEVRAGGPVWSFTKPFAALWSIFMLAAAIDGKLATSAAAARAGAEAGHAGDVVLTGFGMAMIGGLWFIVLVAALGIGLYFRKPGSIELSATDRTAKTPRRA